MSTNVVRTLRDPTQQAFEVVERKGIGHPDTLSDHLAEHLSRTYGNYTVGRFGAVLRHQFDKTMLMCGRSRVSFGGGELLEPIRVLVNGRASCRLGDDEIPVRDLLVDATRAFFRDRFPMLDPVRDTRILFEVRSGEHTTTGGIFGDDEANAAAVHYRFHPRTVLDLPETSCVRSNDTSLGCAFAPFSTLERLVLTVEQTLNVTSMSRGPGVIQKSIVQHVRDSGTDTDTVESMRWSLYDKIKGNLITPDGALPTAWNTAFSRAVEGL
jgi:S-adenosylmethionine synthetase